MAADPVQAGMSSLLMQAAQSAAAADGLAPPDLAQQLAARNTSMARPMGGGGGAPNTPSNKKKGPPLRRGKWTPEEEAYANRLIQEFKAGLLPLTDGTTLRTFLSKLLNCDPMRISKKFVGSNCIGKQVFRRRNADLNRLTPEQIQQSRTELSELERRFLERVAQTNRVKSSGVGGQPTVSAPAPLAAAPAERKDDYSTGNINNNNTLSMNLVNNNINNYADPPSPPWLQPPLGYKHGTGAAFAQAHLGGANSRAAAAGRAMLEGLTSSQLKAAIERNSLGNTHNNHQGNSNASNLNAFSSGMLLHDLQQRASQQNLLSSMESASNLLAAARNGSQNALAQLAQNASAARLAGLTSNSSMNNLMLKTGLSRDQLSQLARDRGLSSGSLSNMIQRQNSFDALMSLDFQSLQSIDNLANLMQTGGVGNHVPETGMQNADFGGLRSASSRGNLGFGNSNGDLSTAARRLASAGRMESLLKNMSNNNMRAGDGSSATLSNLLQSTGGGNISAASLFGAANSASAASLANLLRQDSGTGLSALRMQDGLNNRNSSVDDFLSLVAAGDIPHQDPNLLNVPLMHQQQQQQGGGNNSETAKLLAQHQQLLASSMSNSALANALASRSLGNFQAAASNSNLNQSTGAAALAMAQARANEAKRKLDDMSGHSLDQGGRKR